MPVYPFNCKPYGASNRGAVSCAGREKGGLGTALEPRPSFDIGSEWKLSELPRARYIASTAGFAETHQLRTITFVRRPLAQRAAAVSERGWLSFKERNHRLSNRAQRGDCGRDGSPFCRESQSAAKVIVNRADGSWAEPDLRSALAGTRRTAIPS
jgi:hypothetical protein